MVVLESQQKNINIVTKWNLNNNRRFTVKIFLDMDDVIVEFNKPAHDVLGIPHTPWPWEIGEFYLPCYDDDFWKSLDASFWAGRSWTESGEEILQFLIAMVGIDSIHIITTPAPFGNGRDFAGKTTWLKNNAPQLAPRLAMMPDKSLLKGNGILLDDAVHNVRKFRDEGGTAVLIPACHNHLHRMDVMKHVRRSTLRAMKG